MQLQQDVSNHTKAHTHNSELYVTGNRVVALFRWQKYNIQQQQQQSAKTTGRGSLKDAEVKGGGGGVTTELYTSVSILLLSGCDWPTDHTMRYEGWDLRPSCGQPLGSSLSRWLSSKMLLRVMLLISMSEWPTASLLLKQTGCVGLALARICVSLEISNKDNFPTNGLISIQFTLEDSSQILL